MEIRVDEKNIEKALWLLKRNMQYDGLFRELKNKRFYEKPSLKKKRKRSAEAKAEKSEDEQATTGRIAVGYASQESNNCAAGFIIPVYNEVNTSPYVSTN